MSARETALRSISSGTCTEIPTRTSNNVGAFSVDEQKSCLPSGVFKKIQQMIAGSASFDEDLVEGYASALIGWARQHGASQWAAWYHPIDDTLVVYTQPLYQLGTDDDEQSKKHLHKQLIQHQIDGSGLPNAGRLCSAASPTAFTLWDPMSMPPFIMRCNTSACPTLYIPSVVATQAGDPLDLKIPLLRSMKVLSTHALETLRSLNDQTTQLVHACCSFQQEFYVIDRQFYNLRPDIVQIGRTVQGAPPPGAMGLPNNTTLSLRVQNFVQDAHQALLSIGVPVSITRIGATAQFQLCTELQQAPIAVDHSQIAMQVTKDTAEKHGLAVLWDDKPFKGFPGNRKTLRWTARNTNKEDFLRFDHQTREFAMLRALSVLMAVLRGVDLYGDLIRCCITSYGTSLQAAEQECPSPVVAVHLGEEMSSVCQTIMNSKDFKDMDIPQSIDLGTSSLPPAHQTIHPDNNTAVVAYTDEGIEVRGLGGSKNPAHLTTVFSTIVADSLGWVATEINAITRGDMSISTIKRATLQALHKGLKLHYHVVHNEDHSADTFVKEALKRGLCVVRNAVESIDSITNQKNVHLLTRSGIATSHVVTALNTVHMSDFADQAIAEAKVLVDIARTKVLPQALKYECAVAGTLISVKSACNTVNAPAAQQDILTTLLNVIGGTSDGANNVEQAIADATAKQKIPDSYAEMAANDLRNAMDKLRKAVDDLEAIMDDSLWPLPKYRELLCVK
eukprot:TRINITY_DN61582_c0_g1_i1.p1 TRINITY_DN61582_c0_g1~~TRINITY_DN61582_c0_g1_i1.p1  ORF type:complete len:732 (-),score=45.39 TRINITY_DN61582_c0_g1_i1:97-2292(-)